VSIRDFVMIAAGELVLALTFGLGILVGCSIRCKEQKNGNGNG
jgi:hypothetical protein